MAKKASAPSPATAPTASASGPATGPTAAAAKPAKAAPAKPVQREISGGAKGADRATAPGVGIGAGGKREITHQMIAERAYELYTQGAPGGPDDHWRQAESELRSR